MCKPVLRRWLFQDNGEKIEHFSIFGILGSRGRLFVCMLSLIHIYRIQHEKKYGYYERIKVVNDYLFRSYKKDGDIGYGLQIYKDDDLIGDVSFSEEVYIIGYSNGCYYGVLPVNVDLEQFRIIKFKL